MCIRFLRQYYFRFCDFNLLRIDQPSQSLPIFDTRKIIRYKICWAYACILEYYRLQIDHKLVRKCILCMLSNNTNCRGR